MLWMMGPGKESVVFGQFFGQDENLLRIEAISNVRPGEAVLLALLVYYWV